MNTTAELKRAMQLIEQAKGIIDECVCAAQDKIDSTPWNMRKDDAGAENLADSIGYMTEQSESLQSVINELSIAI